MQFILYLAPLIALAAGSPTPVEAAAEVADNAPQSASVQSVSAAAYACSWEGFGQTRFRGSYGTTYGNAGVCYLMPDSRWNRALFSAVVRSGGSVCLRTGSSSCSGGSQVIDSAGYRDMTNLPAYYTWYCGSC